MPRIRSDRGIRRGRAPLGRRDAGEMSLRGCKSRDDRKPVDRRSRDVLMADGVGYCLLVELEEVVHRRRLQLPSESVHDANSAGQVQVTSYKIQSRRQLTKAHLGRRSSLVSRVACEQCKSPTSDAKTRPRAFVASLHCFR